MRNTLSDVMTFPSACQQPSQVGTRLIDREMNTPDVEVRTQREEIRIGNLSSNEVVISNDRDTQMPTSHSGMSSYDTEITGGSPIRTHSAEMIPQLDGPASVCSRRRISENVGTEQETIQRSTVIPRGGYPDDSDSDSHDDKRPHNGQRPSGRRRYQDRSGRPPDRGNDHNRGYFRRGRPLMEMEDPLKEEDPLMMEDPLGMGKIQPWEIRTTRPTRTSWTSEACYSTAAPGHFRYNSSRKYIWKCGPVYVTIG